ncbi:hypothetical protein [Mycobacterium lepromatosis]|uniref:hypothetical protein n=1 Tax=Mycobacterium lepromatosis TaxID=480418 RepID=UPI0005F7BE6D|nr:hypothetical protein [Mycobacterium lepromatosis]
MLSGSDQRDADDNALGNEPTGKHLGAQFDVAVAPQHPVKTSNNTVHNHRGEPRQPMWATVLAVTAPR